MMDMEHEEEHRPDEVVKSPKTGRVLRGKSRNSAQRQEDVRTINSKERTIRDKELEIMALKNAVLLVAFCFYLLISRLRMLSASGSTSKRSNLWLRPHQDC
jgi:hypothetical protein